MRAGCQTHMITLHSRGRRRRRSSRTRNRAESMASSELVGRCRTDSGNPGSKGARLRIQQCEVGKAGKQGAASHADLGLGVYGRQHRSLQGQVSPLRGTEAAADRSRASRARAKPCRNSAFRRQRTVNESAQDAQKAAEACIVALRRPRPPWRKASCTTQEAAGERAEGSSAHSKALKASRIAAACAAANSRVSLGAGVRNAN